MENVAGRHRRYPIFLTIVLILFVSSQFYYVELPYAVDRAIAIGQGNFIHIKGLNAEGSMLSLKMRYCANGFTALSQAIGLHLILCCPGREAEPASFVVTLSGKSGWFSLC